MCSPVRKKSPDFENNKIKIHCGPNINLGISTRHTEDELLVPEANIINFNKPKTRKDVASILELKSGQIWVPYMFLAYISGTVDRIATNTASVSTSSKVICVILGQVGNRNLDYMFQVNSEPR